MKKILVVDNTFDPPHGSPEICDKLRAAASSLTSIEVVAVRAPEGKIPEDISAFDGVVLSGSKTRIEERAPWIEAEIELIRKLHAEKIPTLGICYGEQLIALTLLGEKTTGESKLPEYGWVEITLDSGKNSALLQGLQAKFYSYQAHSDEVYPSVEVDSKIVRITARSERCGVQAYDLLDAPMFGLQFHPERDLARGNEALDQRRLRDPQALVLNREIGEKVFDGKVAQTIFSNFLKVVLGATK